MFAIVQVQVQPNETPILFSVRQITLHRRLERAKSKERSNELGIPIEEGRHRQAPTFVEDGAVEERRAIAQDNLSAFKYARSVGLSFILHGRILRLSMQDTAGLLRFS